MKGAGKILRKQKTGQDRQSLKNYLKNNWQLYVMILPAVVYFFAFDYVQINVCVLSTGY